MRKLHIDALIIVLLCVLSTQRVFAHDTSGLHAFFNDDRHQFVDFWLNEDGNVTIKVSNGRQWRPMWVVVHASFMSGEQVLARKDYHVYCQSPLPGGHGQEAWFRFAGPGMAGITSVTVHTNKERPWKHPAGGWEIMISASAPAP